MPLSGLLLITVTPIQKTKPKIKGDSFEQSLLSPRKLRWLQIVQRQIMAVSENRY